MSLSWWCYLTVSSSASPCPCCLKSFPASGSFSVNQRFTSGDQSIGASASTSVLPMNIQGWFPCSGVFSSITIWAEGKGSIHNWNSNIQGRCQFIHVCEIIQKQNIYLLCRFAKYSTKVKICFPVLILESLSDYFHTISFTEILYTYIQAMYIPIHMCRKTKVASQNE